jgi:hypothetical protein
MYGSMVRIQHAKHQKRFNTCLFNVNPSFSLLLIQNKNNNSLQQALKTVGGKNIK